MTTLDARTDLFDLFGQSGTCGVCLEDMLEGERVRAVRGCDHLFHAACVEPWLLSRGTCPHCRRVVIPQQPIAGALNSSAEAVQTLHAAIQATTGEAANPAVAGILLQIEQFLQQTQSVLTTHRALLTYCLGVGILNRFKTAAAFNEVSDALRSGLAAFEFEGVHPHRLGCDTRSAFLIDYGTARETLANAYPNQGPIHHLAPVVALTNRLRAARSSSQFLQNYWRTD